MKKNGLFRGLFIIALIFGGTALFGADKDPSAFLEPITNFVRSLTEFVPQLGNLLLTLLGWFLIVVLGGACYFWGYRHFKKSDERNEGETSATITHAKAGSTALVGFIAGLVLFHTIFITGMNLDEAIGTSGNPASFGEVVAKVLKFDID